MANEECSKLLPTDVTTDDNVLGHMSSSVTYEEIFDTSKHERLIQPTWRHYCIAPVAFLFASTFLMSFTVLTQYTFFFFVKNETVTNIAQSSRCSANTSSQDFKDYQEAQENASTWNIYFSLGVGIPAIFSNIILGSYSDRVGRKKLMLLCSCGTFVRIIIMTIGIYLKTDLYIFIIGMVIDGCTGFFVNFLQLSHIFVADITHAGKSRSIGMAILALSFGIGITITAPVAGVIIQTYGFFVAIVVSMFILFIAILCIVFILPETLTKEHRSSEKSIMAHIHNVLKFYTKDKNRSRYILTTTAYFFVSITILGKSTVEILYQLNMPFCWTPVHIGIYVGIKGFIQDVLGLFLVKLFRGCATDDLLGMLGALSATGYSLMVGFAQSATVLYIAPIIGIGSMLPVVLTKAMVSSMTATDKQGALFAGFAVIETICQMSSAVASNAIYSATIKIFTGFVFLVFAACSFISAALLLIIQLWFKKQ